MALTSLILVLTAALLHALWNALVKSSSDGLITTWGVVTFAAIVNVPVLWIFGLPERNVMWIVPVSAGIHASYNLLLVAAYRRADLAVVYPIARGIAPPLVGLVGIALLGDAISAAGLVGIALITSGLATLVIGRSVRGVGWAIATGFTIAMYTLIDGTAVRLGNDSLRFIAAVFVVHALILTGVVLTARGPSALTEVMSNQPGRLLVGGAASAAAYLLVLIVARTESLGLVAGLRETSVVFGLIVAHRFLGERITRRHGVAVALIVIGAIGVALG